MKRLACLLIAFTLLIGPGCALLGGAERLPQATQPATKAPATAMPAATQSATQPEATRPAASPTAPRAVPGAPDVASYTIDVTLDAAERSLRARQRITYRNTAAAPFDELVFHLYLNAFRSADTIFMQESGGQLRGHAFNPQAAGWIEVSSLRLAEGASLALEPLADGTLARAALPRAVDPGETLALELEFTAQLPEVFARTGWVIDRRGDPFFLVGQWFPKLGVWTDSGWVADPFHGNAEFFADFGEYDVSITLPDGYITGATGLPAGQQANPDGTQTVRYRAEGVIDFAWVASPHLRSASRQVGAVEIVYLYLPEHNWSARRILDVAGLALETFSDWFGAYPYARLTVVDVPEEGPGAGGMEYPTFITVGAREGRDRRPSATPWAGGMEVTTVHEVAHQWWQSLVATNEAREPWLDEGFADYSTARLFIEHYGLPIAEPERVGFDSRYLEGRRQAFLRAAQVPMHGAAWEFAYRDYAAAVYAKPVMAFLTLEQEIGEETMLAIFRAYFERYRFGHPTTEDFRAVAVEISGEPLDWFFDGLVYGEQTINYAARSIDGDAFLVEREGELALPVEVLVRFARGADELVTCPPEPADCRQRFPGRVIQAIEVDPERRLVIDLDWSDNALSK